MADLTTDALKRREADAKGRMPDLSSTEDLARLAEAITPGPWKAGYTDTHIVGRNARGVCSTGGYNDTRLPQEQIVAENAANAEAIALLPALIREVLDRREAEAWRDISTAPLTGERALVWRPTMWGGKGHVGVAYWASDQYAKNSRPFWSSVEGYISKTENRAHPPTHWRPLPAPPTTPPRRPAMANDAQMPELLQRARYMINNPSAWDSFDQGASDMIEALCSALCASGQQVRALEEAVQAERSLSDRLAGALEYIDDYALSYPDLGALSAVAQPAIRDHADARAALTSGGRG